MGGGSAWSTTGPDGQLSSGSDEAQQRGAQRARDRRCPSDQITKAMKDFKGTPV